MQKENRESIALLVALIQKSNNISGPVVEIPPSPPLQSATEVSSLTLTNKISVTKRKAAEKAPNPYKMRDGDNEEDDNESHESSPERKRTCNKDSNSDIIPNIGTPVPILESVPQAPPEVIAEIIQQEESAIHSTEGEIDNDL